MKAIVYTEYGPPDVLQLKEVEKPTNKEDEVLVKVHAASLNAGDWNMLKGEPLFLRLMGGVGLQKPKHKILGLDIAGRVEAVGSRDNQISTPIVELLVATSKVTKITYGRLLQSPY